ncbi:MAG: helix-hairpin-helix domain-containing protein [Desulfamplus sp.]|nr:helix-hairpin-helix domain-containing protein [Desulfamplus sp.]
MVMKKGFFVLLALMAVFFFTSSLSASDTKIEDNPKKINDVKSKSETEVKPEIESKEKNDADAKSDVESKEKTDAVKVKTININTATVDQLSEGLMKVGLKYGAAIVKYREENGPFQTPEDIKKVKGIGDKIFEMNKNVIVVKD